MDVGKLQKIYEDLRSTLSALSSKVEEAKEEALNARNNAQYARQYAHQAHEDADHCDDRLIEFQEQYNEAQSILTQIEELIEETTDEQDEGAATESLSYQKAKWRDRVLGALRKGHTPAKIAGAFGISEVLIDLIKREAEREAESA